MRFLKSATISESPSRHMPAGELKEAAARMLSASAPLVDPDLRRRRGPAESGAGDLTSLICECAEEEGEKTTDDPLPRHGMESGRRDTANKSDTVREPGSHAHSANTPNAIVRMTSSSERASVVRRSSSAHHYITGTLQTDPAQPHDDVMPVVCKQQRSGRTIHSDIRNLRIGPVRSHRQHRESP
jgi:hypothetical protein